MDKHKLIVDSVVVRFGQRTVLSGGYITSETGMVTGLLGRNGAGKSCMFRALMGGLRVENVMVSMDEKPVDRPGRPSADTSSTCLKADLFRKGCNFTGPLTCMV